MLVKTSKTRVNSRISETRITHKGVETSQDVLVGGTTVNNTVTHGDNLPNWRQLISTGQNATTTLSGTMYRYSGSEFSLGQTLSYVNPPRPDDWTEIWNIFGTATRQTFGGFAGITSSVTADNKAKQAMVSAIRNTQTAFQGGVFLGELAESLLMIANPARALKEGFGHYLAFLKKKKRSVRKSPFKKRAALAKKIVTDTWLEYSLGWRPLIFDINNAADALARVLHGAGEERHPIHGSGEDVSVSHSSNDSVYSAGPIDLRANDIDVEKHIVKYYGSVRIADPSHSAPRLTGFSLDNFVPTVWELIPYSFVVDYFSNIGAILYAATTDMSTVAWMARTSIHEQNCSRHLFYVPLKDGNERSYRLSPPDPYEIWNQRVIDRQPYTGSLVPSFQVFTPKIATPWLNVGALLLGARNLTPYYR